MKKKIQSLRGMKDYFFLKSELLRKIENILEKILINYGFSEIKLPIIENTKLFEKSIGKSTDVVSKEMYTFLTNNKKRSLTLRPEGTTGCVRAAIENNLLNNNQKQRFWYVGPMFRYERPQKGRYRQFYQLGAEVFGFWGPSIDIEIILMISRFWKILKIEKYLKLNINTIGSFEERMLYQKKLISFLKKNKSLLDENSKNKLYKNPIKILDTKNKEIQKLLLHAPKLSDFLNNKSREHFKNFCNMLKKVGISYRINTQLVRGLDYYNYTVFEWITNDLGAQNAICAGGRYDNLVEKFSNISVPAIGFAIGLDRLGLLIDKIYPNFLLKNCIYVYVMIINKMLLYQYILLIEKIRNDFPKIKIIIYYNNMKKKFNIIKKINKNFLLTIHRENNDVNTILLQDLFSNQEKYFEYSLLKKFFSSILKNNL